MTVVIHAWPSHAACPTASAFIDGRDIVEQCPPDDVLGNPPRPRTQELLRMVEDCRGIAH